MYVLYVSDFVRFVRSVEGTTPLSRNIIILGYEIRPSESQTAPKNINF